MKERIYTGYAVVSKDILDDAFYKKGKFGISLDGMDLETCKRYCYGDRIVVKTYRDVCARYIELRWKNKYPHFGKSHPHSNPRYIQLWHLQIRWGVDYTNGYEREIVYQKED